MSHKHILITAILGALVFVAPIATAIYLDMQSTVVPLPKIIPSEEVKRPAQTDTSPALPAPIELAPVAVSLPNGATTTFQLAEPFQLAVAAEGLGKARFMAMSPDQRLFLPDLVDYKLSHEGRVFILKDFNEETKQFEKKHTYLTGLRGPNSLDFYTDDEGNHWLYLALTAHLVRYPYQPGDTQPSGEPEIVAEFPNKQSPGEVSVVWHITRTIFFHNDRLYVSVGSGCNSCEELAGSMRAMIYSMNPDGTDQRIEGKGLRNTVGITMVGDELYATANGVDHLGNAVPNEVMYKVEDGQHYGWPFCYAYDGGMVPDTSQEWSNPVSCEEVPAPFAWFEPRSAPLGLHFFDKEAHPVLRNSFLVALHGSFNPAVGAGYEIRRVHTDGTTEVFMSGLLDGATQLARPVDFLQHDKDSFFFTDDHAGRVYYVYSGE